MKTNKNKKSDKLTHFILTLKQRLNIQGKQNKHPKLKKSITKEIIREISIISNVFLFFF